MKLTDGRIAIMVGKEHTTIEVIDNTSSTTFVKITLTPEQLSSALARIYSTDCQISVFGLDRVGKKMEHKSHEFEIPKDLPYIGRDEILKEIIKETLPEGWVSDNYFNSQNTFFEKDGKKYARETIRRWV